MEKVKEIISNALAGDGESIFLLFAVYCLAMCAYSVVYQLRIRSWPSTTGKLLRRRIEKVSGFEWDIPDRQYATDALYQYEVGSKTFEGKKVSPWVMVATHNARFVLERQLARLKVGPANEVAVYYNPADPSRSVLLKPGMVGLVVTACLGLLPLVVYWVR